MGAPSAPGLTGSTPMPDDTKTWQLIHAERAALADTLAGLSADQWEQPSLCAGWSVHLAAGHVVAGAEQTTPNFLKGMAASGFRFNRAIDKAAHRVGTAAPEELIERLRATTSTTNHPPAPVMTMLGEVVVHGEDIRQPLGLRGAPTPDATIACLELYKKANFPTGTKKRIDGLRLVATDVDWTHGDGEEVRGPGLSLLMAMTGRAAEWGGITGDGAAVLGARLGAPIG
jgi:uncharacterized protein (TIGR03083 family)